MAILSDPEGPLVTEYLKQNPVEALNLNAMNPVQAGMALNAIKDKARELKPKTTAAPKPPTKVETSGANIDESSPLLQGATFE
jgi:hypothetical protein